MGRLNNGGIVFGLFLAASCVSTQSLAGCAQECVQHIRTKCKSNDFACACTDSLYIGRLKTCVSSFCNEQEGREAEKYLVNLCDQAGEPLRPNFSNSNRYQRIQEVERVEVRIAVPAEPEPTAIRRLQERQQLSLSGLPDLSDTAALLSWYSEVATQNIDDVVSSIIAANPSEFAASDLDDISSVFGGFGSTRSSFFPFTTIPTRTRSSRFSTTTTSTYRYGGNDYEGSSFYGGSSSSGRRRRSGLSTGAKAGIGIAVPLTIAALAALAAFIKKRKDKNKTPGIEGGAPGAPGTQPQMTQNPDGGNPQQPGLEPTAPMYAGAIPPSDPTKGSPTTQKVSPVYNGAYTSPQGPPLYQDHTQTPPPQQPYQQPHYGQQPSPQSPQQQPPPGQWVFMPSEHASPQYQTPAEVQGQPYFPPPGQGGYPQGQEQTPQGQTPKGQTPQGQVAYPPPSGQQGQNGPGLSELEGRRSPQ